MPVYRIPNNLVFPPVDHAEESGLLGVGGDLQPRRIVRAYTQGIFPWYSEGQPILWFAPDPRFVLYRDDWRIQRSLRKRVRQRPYEITLDTAFGDVIQRCRNTPRPGQDGTWITHDMLDAYTVLHRQGVAHSVEAWEDGVLVGGLYGVGVGGLFCGESMFSHAPDASKIAFVWLAEQLWEWGLPLIDSQVRTDHITRFGGADIDRRQYMVELPKLLALPHLPGPWAFDPGFAPSPLRR